VPRKQTSEVKNSRTRKNEISQSGKKNGCKKYHSLSCLEGHSLRIGFIVSHVNSEPTKMVLTMKDLMMTMTVTSVNKLYERVLILNDWHKCYWPKLEHQHEPIIAYFSAINSSYCICLLVYINGVSE
jgi:hypothetical protein